MRYINTYIYLLARVFQHCAEKPMLNIMRQSDFNHLLGLYKFTQPISENFSYTYVSFKKNYSFTSHFRFHNNSIKELAMSWTNLIQNFTMKNLNPILLIFVLEVVSADFDAGKCSYSQ